MNELCINGNTVARKAGWTYIGGGCGVHHEPRIGWQVYGGCVIEWNDQVASLSSRDCVNLRWNQPIPAPFYFPGHGREDFRDGGLHGISPCGDDDSILRHDEIERRSPTGLRNPMTGALRPLAEIPCSSEGYTLDRVGDSSILPNYGAQSECPYDGQHGIRWLRVALRHLADPFVRRNLAEYAHDVALAWNRARADRILKGPKGEGSEEVGREVAWGLLIAVHAGNTTLRDRFLSIIRHVQSAEGHVHVAPSYGNPAPPYGKWASDMESHFLVIALRAAGANREAAKLAALVCLRPIGKYVEWGTQRGDQAPTVGTAWAAMFSGVLSPTAAFNAAKRWPIPKPVYMGGQWGPFTTKATIRAKLIEAQDLGKFRTSIEGLA